MAIVAAGFGSKQKPIDFMPPDLVGSAEMNAANEGSWESFSSALKGKLG